MSNLPCWRLRQSFIKFLYYINTNEIPGELSHENLIFSLVKITCYKHVIFTRENITVAMAT